MSIHTPDTHMSRTDTTAHLVDAVAVVETSGVVELLTDAAGLATAVPGRGRKPSLGQYTLSGLLCVLYELVGTGQDFTIAAMLTALWDRYTDDQMALIGLGNLRTPGRMAAMRSIEGATPTQKAAARRVWEAEYQRLWQAGTRFFELMDDTPLVANHAAGQRPTKRQVAAAAKKPEVLRKWQLKNRVIGRLIAAGLKVENEKRHPGTTVHAGILADHEGHLAIDETHPATGLWGIQGKGKAPGNFMARAHEHSRVFKGAPALIGLTLGVAVPSPTQSHDIPLVCLGAVLHHPTGGWGPAAVTVLDEIAENGLRPPVRSNRTQRLVVDGGYTKANDLNRHANARGYGMVMKYAKDQQIVHEIGAVMNADGTKTPGVYLYSGRFLCPGLSAGTLNRLLPQLPERHKPGNKRGGKTARTVKVDGAARTEGDVTAKPKKSSKSGHDEEVVGWTDDTGEYDGRELDEHATLVKTIEAFTMPTNGRPKEVTDRRRGGQPKNPTEPPATVMQVTVGCPHLAGTVRCRIFESFEDPARKHLPIVPNPPVDLEPEQRPACCRNNQGSMKAKIDHKVFKNWQPDMPGTWEHDNWYTGPRSSNERFNNDLQRPHGGGGDLGRGKIGPRKAAPYAFFVAMAIVHTNRVNLESWYAKVCYTGVKPPVKNAAHRAEREQVLRAYRAKERRRRRAG